MPLDAGVSRITAAEEQMGEGGRYLHTGACSPHLLAEPDQ